jgi:hypothetical protein
VRPAEIDPGREVAEVVRAVTAVVPGEDVAGQPAHVAPAVRVGLRETEDDNWPQQEPVLRIAGPEGGGGPVLDEVQAEETARREVQRPRRPGRFAAREDDRGTAAREGGGRVTALARPQPADAARSVVHPEQAELVMESGVAAGPGESGPHRLPGQPRHGEHHPRPHGGRRPPHVRRHVQRDRPRGRRHEGDGPAGKQDAWF